MRIIARCIIGSIGIITISMIILLYYRLGIVPIPIPTFILTEYFSRT